MFPHEYWGCYSLGYAEFGKWGRTTGLSHPVFQRQKLTSLTPRNPNYVSPSGLPSYFLGWSVGRVFCIKPLTHRSTPCNRVRLLFWLHVFSFVSLSSSWHFRTISPDTKYDMSVTTLDRLITSTLSESLQDYEIQLTGAQDLPQHRWVPLSDHEVPALENPPNWDAEHRGVPNYRPVNTQLDRSQRPWGSNAIETGFVFSMLHGVWLTSMVSWTWRQTGGRFNDTYWRWKVGGEF
ncbi:uncharacterized protein BCR38DRAFT_418166 [Pseudomassariella vexata]|uniref:Uncharacterized protein n=1 Tax=Pseudomassariella vexata TaxID=1141098 RepID=A0A1Y2EJV2_9PEZI|nr:uncharacterized protein BCR38DRAFT_418166 [Pseudomassariella vexata]ORY71828.1 hypothetical protein BCR38DRAFT_418166 [Pseudomassariella vexata]